MYVRRGEDKRPTGDRHLGFFCTQKYSKDRAKLRINMLHKVACVKHFPLRGHAIDNIQEFVFSSQAQLWGNGKRESVQGRRFRLTQRRCHATGPCVWAAPQRECNRALLLPVPTCHEQSEGFGARGGDGQRELVDGDSVGDSESINPFVRHLPR